MVVTLSFLDMHASSDRVQEGLNDNAACEAKVARHSGSLAGAVLTESLPLALFLPIPSVKAT